MSAKPQALDVLRPGQTGVIHYLDAGDGPEICHLIEMGLTVGTPVRLVKVAPLGDPLEIHIRGYHLTVRRAEAGKILVEI